MSEEVFISRVITAILWSIAVHCLFSLLILFVLNFSLCHPVSWIQESVSSSLLFETWIGVIPLSIFIFVYGLMYYQYYRVPKKYYGTRFSMFCSIFSIHNIIFGILHVIIGGTIAWNYLSLLKGRHERVLAECVSDGKTVVAEENMFILITGFWIGFYFFVVNFILNSNILAFPVIQQLKFLQVKTELQPLIKEALKKAIVPTLIFYVLYWYERKTICSTVAYTYGCNFHPVIGFNFVKLSLLFNSWLCCTIFILTMNTLKFLFQVHLTESIVFPITKSLGKDTRTLEKALARCDYPLLQYLGYMDLKNLAEKDCRRRSELFALSQPGGHPRNWNAVLQESLKLINAFIEELNKANIDSFPSLELKDRPPQRENFGIMNSSVYAYCGDMNASAMSMNTSAVGMNTSVSRIRNMSLRAPASPNISLCQPPDLLRSPLNITQQPVNISQFGVPQLQRVPLSKRVKFYSSQAFEAICKTPCVSFMFGELPDARIRHSMNQSQPVMWAVQGVSHLAAASFREDSYGVVQKDLPVIITALIQLKQCLDKLPGNYKKSQRTENYEIRMKCALRSAVKRSLYCICIEFGDYLKELPLKKDVAQQLHNFLLFKEG